MLAMVQETEFDMVQHMKKHQPLRPLCKKPTKP